MGQTTSQLFCQSNRHKVHLNQSENEINGYDIESQHPQTHTTTARPPNGAENHHQHHQHHTTTTRRGGDDTDNQDTTTDDQIEFTPCECTAQLPAHTPEEIELSFTDLVNQNRIGTDVDITISSRQPTIHIWQTGPLACNTILIADPQTNEAIIIDPGGNTYQEITGRKKRVKVIDLVEEIKGLGFTIIKIVVTHAHFDHFLGLGAFRVAFPDAKVWVHTKEKIPWMFLPMQLSMMRMRISKANIDAIGSADEFFVNIDGNNEPLNFLDGVVIHTPGHSEGSICIHFPSLFLLISGDTLFRNAVGRSDLNGGSTPHLRRSILTKLYTLPNHTNVIPGHGPKTMIGHEKANNPTVKFGDAVPPP